MAKDDYSFRVEITTDDDTGEILAVYLRVREGKAAKTVEKANGAVFVDYDKNRRLLGVEMLEPCPIAVVEQVATNEKTKRFLRGGIPLHMIRGNISAGSLNQASTT
jgi:uncharacterized protein YuzE